MELYYYGLSDPGMIRANNEDYLFAGKLKEEEYLFIVADGMGGHQAGEVASRKAVTVFVQLVEKHIGSSANGHTISTINILKNIVTEVNEILMAEGSRSVKKNGMGTTLSVLFIKNELGYIVHVGDSRIYSFEESTTDITGDGLASPNYRLKQLTEDHSFVGKLVKDGFISEEEARVHPKRNVLYQSIGLKQDITIQAIDAIPIRKGQKFLLCSDGLHGVITDQEFKEFLKATSTNEIAGKMVKRANFNGGPDNISVIIVSTDIDDTTGLEDTVKIVNIPQRKTKKQSKWVFILLGLLVLLLALIVFFLLRSSETTTTVPTSPELISMCKHPGTFGELVKGL